MFVPLRSRLPIILLALAIAALGVLPAEAQSRSKRRTALNVKGSAASGAVRVTSFSPLGYVANQPPPVIVVEFSRDVVSKSDMQTTASTEGLLQFDPSLEGFAKWETPRRLRFTARSPLRMSSRYLARVTPRVGDLADAKLEGETEFRFNTAPLTLLKAEQTGFKPDRSVMVTLSFSDEIAPPDLAKYLSVSSAGAPLRWRVESDVRSRTPRIITDPVTSDSLAVRLEPGLPGASGPLGLSARAERMVPLTHKLVAMQLGTRWEQDKVMLVLRFSNQVSMNKIQEHIRIEPDVAFEANDEYDKLVLSGDFKPEQRYTVTVREGLQGTNGRLLLKDAKLSVWVPPMKPFIELKDAGGHLSTQGTMKMRLRSAGVPGVRATAVKVYDNNLVYFTKGGQGEYYARQLGREVGEREVRVTGEPGKVATTDLDLRELLGKDASGAYFIRVEAERPDGAVEAEDAGDYYYERRNRLYDSTIIALSNIGIVAKRSPSQLGVWIAAMDTARPLAGVTVRAYSLKNQLLKEGKTGADGMVMFEGVTDDEDSVPQVIVASQGDETSFLDMRQSLSGEEAFQTDGRAFIQQGYEAFVSGERGAYRPGETAHVFGIVRGRGAAPPTAAFPVEIEVQRPDGKRWEPTSAKTSDTGMVEQDISIPAYAPTGLYTVRVQMPGTADERGKARNENY